jgi:hypothetical protein
MAQLGSARALSGAGDIEGASKAYDAFLASWRAADPDLPVHRAAQHERQALASTRQ